MKLHFNNADLEVKPENTTYINDTKTVIIKVKANKDECSFYEETGFDKATEKDVCLNDDNTLLLTPNVIEECRKIQSTNSDQMLKICKPIVSKVGQDKEEPFFCDICNKDFSGKDKMQTHMRFHRKDNLYSCVVCNKEFMQKKFSCKTFDSAFIK